VVELWWQILVLPCLNKLKVSRAFFLDFFRFNSSCGLPVIPPRNTMHVTVFTQCQSRLGRAWNSIFARVFKGTRWANPPTIWQNHLRRSPPPELRAYLPERNDPFEMVLCAVFRARHFVLDIMSTSESRQSFKTTSEILAYIRECYVEKQQEKDPYLSSVDWDCVLETGIYREERDAELNE